MPTTLPNYIDITSLDCPPELQEKLRQESQSVIFPLTAHVKYMISQLVAKFDQERNCVGLAAPQIGFAIKAIVFEVKANPDVMKWRSDLNQTMSKSIWLNPVYQQIGCETVQDYEGCFSVSRLICEVKRSKKIRYKAYDVEGNLIEGEAEGFLARVIQHEIDHINGILCIDRAVTGTIEDRKHYHEKRKLRLQKIQPHPTV